MAGYGVLLFDNGGEVSMLKFLLWSIGVCCVSRRCYGRRPASEIAAARGSTYSSAPIGKLPFGKGPVVARY